MKLGVISDVHSNIDALKAVFNRFEKEKVDKVICAGDVIGIGPFSKECVDFFISNQDKFIVMIRGNHEGYLLDGLPKRNHNRKNGRLLTQEEISMHCWNHNNLREDQIEFIKSWEKSAEIEIDGKKIIVEHYPTNEKGRFKRFHAEPTYGQIKSLCKDKESDVFIFGHTHIDIFYNKDNRFIINPGSLGCPVKTGGANFGILTIEKDKIDYKQLVEPYDVEKVIDDIHHLHYPIHKAMIKIFYDREYDMFK